MWDDMFHGIGCILDFHLNWVLLQVAITNVINYVSCGVMFQELHANGNDIIQFLPFVHIFLYIWWIFSFYSTITMWVRSLPSPQPWVPILPWWAFVCPCLSLSTLFCCNSIPYMVISCHCYKTHIIGSLSLVFISFWVPNL